MSSFPNIRANRINAQTISSNFYQGSNADITNIACDNLAVSNFVFNDATFNGEVVINSTTQSTAPTNGALVVVGGVGVGKNLNIGQNLGVTQNAGFTGYVNIYNMTNTNSLGSTGAFVVNGGAVVQQNLYVGGTGYIEGDLGVTGDLEVDGTINGAYVSFSDTNFSINTLNTMTGTNNTVYGYDCYAGSGNSNVAFGSGCLSNDTGNNNVAIGYLAMGSAISNNTIAVGVSALQTITDGITGNVAIGYQSGYLMEDGDCNVFIGSYSGTNGVTGTTGCVCIGCQSGTYTTGNYNTFIGYQSGYTDNNYYGGTGLICIGANSYPSDINVSNECTIYVGGSVNNTARFSEGSGTWTFSSDQRDKTDISPINSGIQFINQLQPSKYRWDKREWYENGIPDGTKKNENWYSGFIAQQLDEVQTNNDADFLNLVYKSNTEKLEIAPNNLIPVIVKALQDLSEENNNLKARLDQLEKLVKLEK